MGTQESLHSIFRGQEESKEQETKARLSPGQDHEDEIAHFPYVEFTGRDSITCPTCQGTGRVQAGRMNELVALIPYSDQRLQPQRTKVYVLLSVLVCLLVSILAVVFLFPRSVLINSDGFETATVTFDKNNSKVFIALTSILNISNSNFYSVSVDSLSSQVFYMNTVIGSKQLKKLSVIRPLSKKQVNFTVDVEIGENLNFVYTFCTMPSVGVHNIVITMRTTVKVLYLRNKAQNSLEWLQYVDCGASYSNIQKVLLKAKAL